MLCSDLFRAMGEWNEQRAGGTLLPPLAHHRPLGIPSPRHPFPSVSLPLARHRFPLPPLPLARHRNFGFRWRFWDDFGDFRWQFWISVAILGSFCYFSVAILGGFGEFSVAILGKLLIFAV